MKYKCKNCGSNDVVECLLISNVEVSCYNNDCDLTVRKDSIDLNIRPGELKALVCKKCGHVEWFHTYPEAVRLEKEQRKKREKIEKQQAHQREVWALEYDIKMVERQIAKARTILKDENSTLKQAKQAKELIKEKEKKLKKLKLKKDLV